MIDLGAGTGENTAALVCWASIAHPISARFEVFAGDIRKSHDTLMKEALKGSVEILDLVTLIPNPYSHH